MTDLTAFPSDDIAKALTPWAKRNGIDPAALPALLNLVLLQQVTLAADLEAS